jgi:hypothetical protein
MLKGYLAIPFLIAIVVFGDLSFAQFKPDGIGDLEWGQPAESIKDAIFVRDYVDYPMKLYRRHQYQFSLGPHIIRDVSYMFWNNRLIEIWARSKEAADANRWRSTLEKYFGEPSYVSPSRDSGFYLTWDNVSNADITLSCFEVKDSMFSLSLRVSSLRMIQEKEQFQKSLDSKSGLVCRYDMYSKDCYNLRTIDKLHDSVMRVEIYSAQYSPENLFRMTSTDDFDCRNKLKRTIQGQNCIEEVNKDMCLPEKSSQQWQPINKRGLFNWVYEEICQNK